MKKTVLFLALCAASKGWAQDLSPLPQSSLFMTAQQAHEAETLAQKSTAGTGDIHLGAVIYYGPQDWVLWLQGARWTPQTARDDLRVLDVSEKSVAIWWRNDETGDAREIRLKPNESYQIATGKIIEAP